ncbi:MAG: hypothetical protein ACKERG_03480 [Candidatus Hodgkinia cicadicola]
MINLLLQTNSVLSVPQDASLVANCGLAYALRQFWLNVFCLKSWNKTCMSAAPTAELLSAKAWICGSCKTAFSF